MSLSQVHRTCVLKRFSYISSAFSNSPSFIINAPNRYNGDEPSISTRMRSSKCIQLLVIVTCQCEMNMPKSIVVVALFYITDTENSVH